MVARLRRAVFEVWASLRVDRALHAGARAPPATLLRHGELAVN